jgi:small-conductance mechanosensitive channel
MSFGDSSVNFEIRFWISDPRNGIQNIRSQVLLSIWDNFKEHDIEIPFPQQDYHLRSLPEDLNNYFKSNQIEKNSGQNDNQNENNSNKEANHE